MTVTVQVLAPTLEEVKGTFAQDAQHASVGQVEIARVTVGVVGQAGLGPGTVTVVS